MTRLAALLLACLALAIVAFNVAESTAVLARAEAPDPLTWFAWSPAEPPIAVPVAWAEWAYPMGICESGWNPDAVGAQGERGIYQLSIRQQQQMARAGLDPSSEPDRIAWAVSLWGWSGESWRRHWSCARLVGAP